MDSGKYIDFNVKGKPNTVWNFIPTEDGFSFKEYHLSHAKLGDSDSIYCSLPPDLTDGTSIDEIVDASNAIVEYVNDNYPDFVMHAFNCPKDRTHHIESNREIVADAVFVVTKKRYAARVIDDEGAQVNKLKIMGLEVKRSDTPLIVQEYLHVLIEMILDDHPKENIKKKIKEMKELYKSEDLRALARPMSCKGLGTHEKKLKVTGSDKGFPYQVRAAMFYNSLCGAEDRKINPGEKINIIYIKDRRSKYIAFPADINTIPDFISNLVIDYETQWEKAEKKIISYLEAMEWDIKSQKASVTKELFDF